MRHSSPMHWDPAYRILVAELQLPHNEPNKNKIASGSKDGGNPNPAQHGWRVLLVVTAQTKQSCCPQLLIADSKMDLATRFNSTGVLLYDEGKGGEAFEIFHASLQVLLRTPGLTTADMDPQLCQLLALHHTVYNALIKNNLIHHQHDDFDGKPVVATSSDAGLYLENGRVRSCGTPSFVSTELQRCLRGFRRSRTTSASKKTNEEERDPCLYTQVFKWSSLPFHCYNQEEALQQYIVAVASDLYNMALVLHRGQVMESVSGCLERALILYSFAGELLWNNLGYNLLFTDHHGVRLSSLYCAILNNTGYLLHQMGHFDWGQLFFQRLHQFLSFMGPAASADEQKERDAFQLNVVVLFRSQTGAAAA